MSGNRRDRSPSAAAQEGPAVPPAVVERPRSLEELKALLRRRVPAAAAAAAFAAGAPSSAPERRGRSQPPRAAAAALSGAGQPAPPSSVVVRSREPDDREMAQLPSGAVVIVVDPALGVSEGGAVSVPPAAARAMPGSIATVTLTRAATMRDVVEAQKANSAIRHAHFPVTAASMDKPVLSALFRGNDPRNPQNYYQRSAPKPLDQVRSFTYLPLQARAATDVVETTWTRATGDEQAEAEGPPTPSLDDKLVLRATLQADPDEARRQVRRAVFLYDPQVFERDILDSFRAGYAKALKDRKLDGVDVTVEVFNQPAYVAALMVVVVTASSTDRRHDQALEALFPRLFGGEAGSSFSSSSGSAALLQSHLLIDPDDIHGMETPMADRHDAFNLPSTEYGGFLTVDGAADGFFYWLKWAVHSAARQDSSDLQAHFRLVPENGKIYANVVVFVADPEEQRLRLSSDELEALPPLPPLPPPGLVEIDARPALRRPAAPLIGEPPRTRRRLAAPASPVLGLGKIDVVREGKDYSTLRIQYASHGGSYPDAHFRPDLIARPKTVDEIKKVVVYAIKNGKRVVTRSGGHQYCGFSSGAAGSVQIVMDSFMRGEDGKDDGMELSTVSAEEVRRSGCTIVSPDGQGWQHFVSVAPRCRLEDVSAKLKGAKLTIPHGECPKVGIGGHVQTGGYGHQMRGLGLCLDYVYSFDIVVCAEQKQGSEPAVKVVTVNRPELNLSGCEAPGKDPELNDSLYKGVLGGSPGAFGVITRVKFLAVHDEDPKYKDSRSVTKVFPHNGWNVRIATTSVVRAMLKFALPNSPSLCEGLDVFVTIASKRILFAKLGIVLPELAYTGSSFSDTAEDQMNEILDACKSSAMFGFGQDLQPQLPSEVAHKGVRTAPTGVTALGREFNEPYKKRVNIMLSTGLLSESDADKFALGFGKLAGKVADDPDLLLVIQMNLGGGQAASNDPEERTGLPYRNQSFLFVFDVFYENKAAKPRAEAIQAGMQKLLDEVGGFDHRMFWGSFGRESGETDMSQANVQEWYYGSAQAYSDMQKIKDDVDPNGTFTTEFTVQNTPRPESL